MHELNWGLPVILYLFLAGLGAGAVTVSGSVLLRKGGFHDSRMDIARYGALIGPIPVMLGTFLIVFELGQPFRALNLFKMINLSPMSIGTWALALFIILSGLYAICFIPRQATWPWLGKARRVLAWLCVPLGISVAIYTGVLLGAMPARPFWNSPILAGLFVLSALSTGTAAIMLTVALFGEKSAEHREGRENDQYLLVSSDALLLGGEMLVIFLFLMFAHLTIGDVRHAVEVILPGGSLASLFWWGVVLIGILFPFVMELFQVVPKLLYGRTFRSSLVLEVAVALSVLAGGFALRYIIVVAGQVTGPTTL
ncbi:NrfD/PsrC family molybdoenzyme membrane anchor subunit [Sedimenticola hydrogenitrophicus]|uniref:NrfD/PsrC family molybdoenzyme membrane anchor subunit n=1 Tax=Sedimenticola hydrogenitrophicus TaxID=2967975 RepID=UPI0021A50AA2|nr:NrfD/PsrC family molybdoenzyme membrane anchor subunit [Sedimenticola hydrogenitrophicus]